LLWLPVPGDGRPLPTAIAICFFGTGPETLAVRHASWKAVAIEAAGAADRFRAMLDPSPDYPGRDRRFSLPAGATTPFNSLRVVQSRSKEVKWFGSDLPGADHVTQCHPVSILAWLMLRARISVRMVKV
jgi:hypothetical protein